MAKGKDTPTAEQEKEARQRKPWTLKELGGKPVWDWMQLLIVPLALAAIGLWFTAQQNARQQEIEDQCAQDAALQADLDQTSQLLIEKDLRSAQPEDNVSVVTRARTLTVLGRLNGEHKRSVLQFLYEAGLISKGDKLVIDLYGADLSDAYLSGAHPPSLDLTGAVSTETAPTGSDPYSAQLRAIDPSGAERYSANLPAVDPSGAELKGAVLTGAELGRADLSGADLTNAHLAAVDLTGADLRGANLRGTDLKDAILKDAEVTDEQLAETRSLEGVTMPGGSKHPQQQKGRGEHGENRDPT